MSCPHCKVEFSFYFNAQFHKADCPKAAPQKVEPKSGHFTYQAANLIPLEVHYFTEGSDLKVRIESTETDDFTVGRYSPLSKTIVDVDLGSGLSLAHLKAIATRLPV